MCYSNLLLTGIILFNSIFFTSCHKPERPGVLVQPEDKPVINAKIENQPWARAIFEKMHSRVTPYVKRHQENPEWILSRYMMNWKDGQHYTQFQGDEEGTALKAQKGNAPIPTVRVTTHKRPPVTNDGYRYKMPPIEELIPYDTNQLMHLQSAGPSGKWDWVDPRSMISSINGRFNELALNAAIIYWLTGEKLYAQFAGDILMQWANGAVYQEPIEGSLRNGMFSVQTLGDRDYAPLALVYDFIYDYLKATGAKTGNVEKVLTRMAETQIERGFVENNWYAAETTTLTWSALALNDKKKQDSLMEYFIARDNIREDHPGFGQKSIKTTVEEFFSEEGHWEEPPNYHNYPVGVLMQAGIAADQNGYRIFQKYPTLFQASYAMSLFAFPNGKAMAFGDCHGRTGQSPQLLELALAMADKYNLEVKKQLIPKLKNLIEKGKYKRNEAGYLGLLTYLPEIPKEQEKREATARSRDLDFAACFLQRNGKDPQNGLMYYVQGASYNHNHANGMAMELYGQDFVLGADPGADVSYNTEAHAKYYKQWAAHNTVLAGGKSRSLNGFSLGTMEMGRIELVNMESAEGNQAISPYYSYTDTKYHDASTDTDQRRVMGIIRTSPETGYYFDFYRSDHPQKNEYVYHNIGNHIELRDQNGRHMPLSSTTGLNEDFGNAGPGYAYFKNKKTTGSYGKNVTGTFILERDSVYMDMKILGEPGRQYFTAQTPRTHTAPAPYDNMPTPTVVIKQPGSAWNKPFSVIFEPYQGKGNNTVTSLTQLEEINEKENFQGIKVKSEDLPAGNTQTDYIFHGLSEEETWNGNGFTFQGNLGVISKGNNDMKRFYLGKGSQIKQNEAGITAQGATIAATLAVEEGGITYSASDSVRLHIPYSNEDSNLAFSDLRVYFKQDGKDMQGENIKAQKAEGVENKNKGIISVSLPKGFNVQLTIK